MPLDVGEDGCPGGCKPGDRLEEGICKRHPFTGQEKRQGAEKAHGGPAEKDDGHAFPLADIGDLGSPEAEGHGCAEQDRDGQRNQHGEPAAIPEIETYRKGRRHGQTEKEGQQPHHIEYEAPAH